MRILEDFIEVTAQCTSKDHIFHSFEKAMYRIGYDRVVYSFLTDHPRLGKKAGHGIQWNYPEDWMQYYQEKRYFDTDPVPKHAFHTAQPFTWDSLVKQSPLSAEELQVMHEAREAKLLDGVGIPLYGPGGEIAGLGLASTTGGIGPDRNLLCLLRAIAHQFHYAYSVESDEQKHDAPPDLLTDKEKEVLHWIAEGKSQGEIADILHISSHTVHFHIKNIFRKLEVSEKTLAVVKAIRMNILHPSRLRVL